MNITLFLQAHIKRCEIPMLLPFNLFFYLIFITYTPSLNFSEKKSISYKTSAESYGPMKNEFFFFNKTGPFPAKKSEWKIEHFERLPRPPATAGGRELSLPL